MIFGKTFEERQAGVEKLWCWHSKFLFLPKMLVDGRFAWLHFVERRLLGQGFYDNTYYEHRAKE